MLSTIKTTCTYCVRCNSKYIRNNSAWHLFAIFDPVLAVLGGALHFVAEATVNEKNSQVNDVGIW